MDAFRTKIEIFPIFASIHRIHFSLNQNQGSIFKILQSIPRIKLALVGSFKKNFGSKNMKKSPKFQFFIHPLLIEQPNRLW